MATTREQQQADQGAFEQAFNEPPPDPKEVSEDEAFGLSPEIPDDNAGDGTPPAATTTEEPAPPAEASPAAAEPASATPSAEAQPAEPAAEPPAADEPPAPAADATEEAGETPAQEAQEQANGDEALEAAYNKAVEAISGDFGPQFLGDFQTIIAYEIRKAIREGVEGRFGEIHKSVQDVIADLNSAKARAHFERIADKHPDFMEIAESPAFAEWVAAQPEAEQARVKQIVEAGSARQVIALLDEFKKAKSGGSGGEDDALGEAEGVRSSGLRLPEQPSSNDDYAEAWEKA